MFAGLLSRGAEPQRRTRDRRAIRLTALDAVAAGIWTLCVVAGSPMEAAAQGSGTFCVADELRCDPGPTYEACVADIQMRRQMCRNGGSANNGNTSPGISSPPNDSQARQRALNDLSATIGSAVEQSQREAADRRAEREAARAGEAASAARQSAALSNASCGPPFQVSAATYDRRASDLEAALREANRGTAESCAKGLSTCSRRREIAVDLAGRVANERCLADKARARDKAASQAAADKANLAEIYSKYASLSPLPDARDLPTRAGYPIFPATPLKDQPWLAEGFLLERTATQPACVKTSNNELVTNDCQNTVEIAWHWPSWQTLSGPCTSSPGNGLPCRATLKSGEVLRVLPAISGAIMAGVVSCPDRYFPVATHDGKQWSCFGKKMFPIALEADLRQVGNRVGSTSTEDLEKQQKAGDIASYRVDASFEASHCMKWEHAAYPGTKHRYSRVQNTCDRDIYVSWFDTDGVCKETSPDRWACAEYPLKPNKSVNTVPLAETAKRTAAACFAPASNIRRGGQVGCATWSK